MAFRDDAIAAYNAARAAERTALIAAARTRMTPILTDHTGKLVLDPKLLTMESARLALKQVVFGTGDGTFFMVTATDVRLTNMDADQWVDGPVVTSMVDVGAKLTR